MSQKASLKITKYFHLAGSKVYNSSGLSALKLQISDVISFNSEGSCSFKFYIEDTICISILHDHKFIQDVKYWPLEQPVILLKHLFFLDSNPMIISENSGEGSVCGSMKYWLFPIHFEHPSWKILKWKASASVKMRQIHFILLSLPLCQSNMLQIYFFTRAVVQQAMAHPW
jgi:hypothetical protein